ncbi:sensor histidine kinase [Leptospira sp. GIMC2001]|uniref:sensor histidine kinase n=1 Tax=Leptospira sp. GIMC2001 TaxID=1513297 RepID=UPI002349977D|nr:ATP-binding protein [Leptospira sp. GIMC2001]WCL50088.1 histidine kinase [Leptospira sp. GIMC2001]
MKKSSHYLSQLVSSLSPLVSMDGLGRVVFTNLSFRKEFPKIIYPIGIPFVDLLKIRGTWKKDFENNRLLAKEHEVQNKEFQLGSKTYGYSLLPAGNETLVILRDISEKKKLEKKVASLHGRLINLQEKERQKIGQDLHDSVGQTILAAKIHFQSGRMESGLELIDRASQELRSIYSNLYPSHIQHLGLVPAVRDLVNQLFIDEKVTIKESIKNPISDEVKLEMYRIIQEACTNITRHAQATKVTISILSNTKSLELVLRDNGKGFDTTKLASIPQGFGLENMKKRCENLNGIFQLTSNFNKGTEIKISLLRKNTTHA